MTWKYKPNKRSPPPVAFDQKALSWQQIHLAVFVTEKLTALTEFCMGESMEARKHNRSVLVGWKNKKQRLQFVEHYVAWRVWGTDTQPTRCREGMNTGPD